MQCYNLFLFLPSPVFLLKCFLSNSYYDYLKIDPSHHLGVISVIWQEAIRNRYPSRGKQTVNTCHWQSMNCQEKPFWLALFLKNISEMLPTLTSSFSLPAIWILPLPNTLLPNSGSRLMKQLGNSDLFINTTQKVFKENIMLHI